MSAEVYEMSEIATAEDIGVAVTDFAKLMAEEKIRAEEFRNRVVARYAPDYPDAKFGDFFLMELRRNERECMACNFCTGLPCKKKKNQGVGYVVQYSDFLKDMTVVNYVCDYQQNYLKMQKIKKQFALAQVPPRYLGKTFKDFDVKPGNENAVRAAKFVLENPRSLYIYGDTGVGKTLLASIIAQELLKRGKAVIFSDLGYLFEKVRASFAKKTEITADERLETLKTAEILILDDFGAEKPTEWLTSMLFGIVNYRYNEGLQTIITSNYALGGIYERLNDPTNDKVGIQGKRIASRLKQMCGVVEIRDEDQRLIKRG